MARYKKKTKSLEELENEIASTKAKIKKEVEKDEHTKLAKSTIAGLAEEATSEEKVIPNISDKTYGSYEEIEEDLGVSRSDAQGFASANIESLKSPLKEEVEEQQEIVRKGMAKDAEIPTIDEQAAFDNQPEERARVARENMEIALKMDKERNSTINIDEGTLVNASKEEKLLQVKALNKILQNKIPSGVSTHTLETSNDTEQAVTELLKDNPATAFSRKDITTLLSRQLISARAMERTKGGPKTGAGKPRWMKNVAWAIQTLSKKGQIKKLGKNAYAYDANANITLVPAAKKPVITGLNIIPKQRKTRTPKAAPQPVIIQASNVQVQAAQQAEMQEQAASQPTVEDREIQPQPQPGMPNPPMVVEHIVKPAKESQTPKMQRNMDLSNVMMTKAVPYIKNANVDDVLNAHFKDASNQPLLFVGPAGVGKTIAVEAYATANHIPLIEVQATPETSDDQLLGHSTYTPNGGVEFQYGAFPKAIEAANKFGSAILLVDEMNLLKPEYQTNLNPLTDYRKAITINETKERFELEPGKKLLVIGTMNPAGYAGTNPLQEALRNRFTEVMVNYAPLAVERRILAKKTGINDDDLITKLITAASFTRNNNQGHLEISTRTLEVTLLNYRAYLAEYKDSDVALKKSIENSILNKYYEEPEYKTEVERKFNATLKGYKGFKGV